MDLNNIKKQIEEISAKNGFRESEIVSAIEAFLRIQYVYEAANSETEQTIEDVKRKVLKTIYRNKGQKLMVNMRTDHSTLFGLDILEMEYLERATDELEAEGLALFAPYEYSLTVKGVSLVKKL
ncbi:hypothetical protein [Sphingobacterium hotanense]|uniref:hypothetical protein n=1 Tax=Sphingobacterium hotanense TaxID=649196 RepID=UPI0021A8FD85|nr:hypothetical protein [Sphingobacterium hotanense]MCT1524150.1 hypothetical protein [Sphingobacterium hotanense]